MLEWIVTPSSRLEFDSGLNMIWWLQVTPAIANSSLKSKLHSCCSGHFSCKKECLALLDACRRALMERKPMEPNISSFFLV